AHTATLKAVKIRTQAHPNTKHPSTTTAAATATANVNAMTIPTYSQFRGALNRYSLHHLPPSSGHSTVAAKITHVKADGSGGGISITGTPIISGGTIKVATAGNAVQTSLGGTPISLNTGQATTAASIRAIGAGGQSTQVRVVMPMIKQLENVTATGRTQITAIPATPSARSVSNASITVTRPVTQATYLPRASVTATQMGGVGVAGAQRLVTPLRATSTGGVNQGTPTGLGGGGSFVRTSQPSTVISSASSAAAAAWIQSPTAVQLIRAMPRQRIITTSTGASVSTTATPVQANTALSVTAAQSLPPQQSGPGGVPQAYVATVLPPRPHQATLVYSSNVSAAGSPTTNPNAGPQFNPRFAVATPLGSAANAAGGAATTPGGTTVTPRQVRPILGKSFPAAKLNTTSISIRAPSIPQLSASVAPPTPVSVSGGVTVAGRGPVGAGTAASVAPVALTANLPTTRIIQLQQPATGGAHPIISSAARLPGSVVLQPFLMSTTAAAKMGIRPPVTMTAKVQPSLTITQLNPIGKLSAAGGAGAPNMQPQGVASIQAVPSVSASVTTSSVASVATGATAAAGGATVLPLTLGARGGPANNILTGTLTPIKNASGITVGKMMIPQSAGVDGSGSGGLPPGSTPTNVFIQQRGGGAGGVSVSPATATSVATSVAGTSFLPQGSSAIYYESMPASTGVLSLTTTTVTQSTHTHTHGHQAQAQLVGSGAGGSLSVSSLPFGSHAQAIGSAAGGSTATFTVLPSSAAGGNRTIGHQQLIIPGGVPPQHMVIPLHTSVKVTTGAAPTTTGGGATVSALPMPIPVPVAANALVSNFMRKRDAEGSPIRGVKNLAPTLLSMSSNSNATTASTANVTAVNLAGGSAFNLQTVSVAPAAAQIAAVATVSSSALTVEALAKKERERVNSAIVIAAAAASSASSASASATAGSIVSTRNMRAESPASSDGSTTVSANSSPGVDQQIQDSNLSINRIGDEAGGSTATHFNPINEASIKMNYRSTMYASHQSAMPPNVTHSALGARVGSAFVDVSPQSGAHHVATTGQLPQARMNGNSSSYDGLARKKPRRSTNDSQHSNQSQASLSLSLPPPTGSVSSHSSSATQEATSLFIQQQQQQQQQQLPHQSLNNGGLLLTAAGAGSVAVTTNASTTGDVNNHRLPGSATPAVAGNKENANPVDFVLRRPRNCSLLNTYKPTHKLANNHFHRYTDVKPRDDRRATVIDLANQPNVQGKISGWKLYHLRSQMEDLNDSEMVSLGQLETMLKELEKDKDKHGDIERVSELLKGNIQRSKIITDGINEAQNQLMKIFDHKPHVSDIINRLQSKRNFKKREKL
ncbi:hypothetical protein KR044_005681, partial [Drosophila immigrans]